MKSCLGSLLLLVTLVALLATGGLIWYLSTSVKFDRKGQAPETRAATTVPTPAPAAPANPPASPFGQSRP